eukprot:318388-Prorocentrum_minimum.AAC.1
MTAPVTFWRIESVVAREPVVFRRSTNLQWVVLVGIQIVPKLMAHLADLTVLEGLRRAGVRTLVNVTGRPVTGETAFCRDCAGFVTSDKSSGSRDFYVQV